MPPIKQVLKTSCLIICCFCILSAGVYGQVDPNCDEVSFTLWTELPTFEKNDGWFQDFYSGIADFSECNPAGIIVNKVIVRFTNPHFDYGPTFNNPFSPSASSPVVTDLLLKLPQGVEVYVLPYVKDWPDVGGQSKMRDVIATIKGFNDIMEGIDPSRKIAGVVLEGEGAGNIIGPGPGGGEEKMRYQANLYKAELGLDYLKLGATYQGGNVGDPPVFGAYTDNLHLDEGYLQVYNMFDDAPSHPGIIYVDAFDFQKAGKDCAGELCHIGCKIVEPYCSSSIYLEALDYPDPAQALFDGNANTLHTFKHLVSNPKFNWSGYNIPEGGAKHIFPMFSVETNISHGGGPATCDYPNTNDPSKCGQINAFGSWKMCQFMEFVETFHSRSGELTNFNGSDVGIPKDNYGLFQYSLIPHAWKVWETPSFQTAGPIETCDSVTIEVHIPECMFYQLYDVEAGEYYGEIYGRVAVSGVYEIDNVLPGRYTIRVFGSNCKKETCFTESDVLEVNQQGEDIAVTIAPDTLVCEGDQVTLTASGPFLSFSWDNSVTNGVPFTPIVDRIYTVTAEDGSCQSTAAVSISVIPFSPGVDTTLCSSSLALNAALHSSETGIWTVVEGEGNFVDSSDPRTVVSGLSAGTNRLNWEITSGVCVGRSGIIQIDVTGNSTVPEAGENIDVCIGDTVQLFGSEPLPVEISEWSISPVKGVFTDSSDHDAMISGLDTGVYTVYWSVRGVCSEGKDSLSLVVHDIPSVNVSINPGLAICLGDELTLTASGANDIMWDNNVVNGQVFIPTLTETYTVIVTNDFGCQADSSFEIVVNEALISDAGTDVTICETETTVVLRGNTQPGATGEWFALNGSISQSGQDGTASGYAVGQNDYVFTLDNGVCVSADTVSVFVDADPSVPTITGPDSVATCATTYFLPGNQATIGVFQWQIVSGSGSIIDELDPQSEVVGLVDGQVLELSLAATNGECRGPFTAFKIFRTGEITTPIASLVGGGTALCLNGGPYQMDATAPNNGETGYWHIESGTTVAIDDISNNQSFVTPQTIGDTEIWWVIDNGVCDSAVAKLVLTVNDVPDAAGLITGYNGNVVCESTKLNLSLPPITGADYHIWNYPDSTEILSLSEDLVFTPSTSGLISVAGQNACGVGEASELMINIASEGNPTISLSSLPNNTKPICVGENMAFSATVTNEGVAPIYRWFIDEILQPETGLTMNRNDLQGTVNVRIELNASPEQCNTIASADDQMQLIFESRTVSFDGKFTLCEGERGCFTESISGGGSNPVVTWSGAVNTSCHTGLTDGEVVTLTMETSNTCSLIPISHTETITVNGGAQAEVITVDTLICEGEEISLEAVFNPNVNSYSWYVSESEDGPFRPVGTNSSSLPVASGGYYYLLVDDGNGCIDSAGLVEVKQVDIVIEVNASPMFIDEGNSSVLDVVVNQVDSIEVIWTDLTTNQTYFGDVVEVAPIKTTAYLVLVKKGRCWAEGEVAVEVNGVIKIPSAFTPNGDGENDEWHISGLAGYPYVVVKVYNRWGNVVHEQYGSYVPWDGTISGEDVPVGTYYYIIDAGSEGVSTFNGPITIIR